MEKTLIVPTLNINGSTRDNLVDYHTRAMRKINEAYAALADMAPHGRDYQTAPPGTHEKAQEQYKVWREQLRVIHNDIESIAIEISNQGYR